MCNFFTLKEAPFVPFLARFLRNMAPEKWSDRDAHTIARMGMNEGQARIYSFHPLLAQSSPISTSFFPLAGGSYLN